MSVRSLGVAILAPALTALPAPRAVWAKRCRRRCRRRVLSWGRVVGTSTTDEAGEICGQGYNQDGEPLADLLTPRE